MTTETELALLEVELSWSLAHATKAMQHAEALPSEARRRLREAVTALSAAADEARSCLLKSRA